MSAHRVEFTAQDGWLVAHCACGWTSKWKPSDRIREGHYGAIFAYGLKHSLDNSNVTKGRTHNTQSGEATS